MKQEEHDTLHTLLSADDPWNVRKRITEWLATVPVEEATEKSKGTRTLTQNNALWKFFQLLADALVAKGVTMRKIFEKTEHFDIPPTKNNVHDLWVYFQKAMYNTDSTTKLKKLEEIDNVHKVVMKNMGEMFEIEYIDFPHDKQKAKENMGGGYKTSGPQNLDKYYEGGTGTAFD